MAKSSPAPKKPPLATARPRASANATNPATASATGGAIIVDGEDTPRDGLVFGRATLVWVGAGIALMVLGMILMAGGAMPSPDVWDEDLIYSFRRITLAPIVILAGLGVITYAILKK